MWKLRHNPKIVLIGTFPPNKCGIASFTSDLYQSIKQDMPDDFDLSVCVIDRKCNADIYGVPANMMLDKHDPETYLQVADNINNDKQIKLVSIEHEFGLFGGELGEDIIGFLSILKKPFVIRFHTVLPNPSFQMFKIVQVIGLLAQKVLVMTKHSAQLLRDDYNIDRKKITLIPHGTHPLSHISNDALKETYDLQNKKVLTTFGLLSPNKGIEKGILAMKGIAAAFPNAVYLVLGQTHPNLILEQGEKYREQLQSIINENNLQNNVLLVNEYFPTQKLMQYLKLTDIYLFTSLDPNQAVSGTFLYAMSAGCPIIANSFVLAKEMLDENTGVILKTNSADELAKNVIDILHNPALKKSMSEHALMKSAHSLWSNVGRMHCDLFLDIIRKNTEPEVAYKSYTPSNIKYAHAVIKTNQPT